MSDKAFLIFGIVVILTIALAAMAFGYNGHVQTAAIGGVTLIMGYKFGFVRGCKHKEGKK